MKPPTPKEIRNAREEVGLTQTEAGERVWMSLRAWQDWEGGKREMLPIVFWAFKQSGVLPELWTRAMLGFPQSEENRGEEESL